MTQAVAERVGYRPRRAGVAHWDLFEVPIKTQGEIEAAICEGMTRFEQQYMGRGPKDIHAHLIGDLLVVGIGVLTVPEQHLVKSLPAEKGRDLLKQVRSGLIETAQPVLAAMIQEVTGVKVLSLHHDISTVTGEEIVSSPWPSRRIAGNRKSGSAMNQGRSCGTGLERCNEPSGGLPMNLGSAPTTS